VQLRTIRGLKVEGRRVLFRADLNVPLDGQRVAEDGRIRAVLPTLQWLLDRGAKVAVCSHLGRPDGRVVEDLRLGPVGWGSSLGAPLPAWGFVWGGRSRKR